MIEECFLVLGGDYMLKKLQEKYWLKKFDNDPCRQPAGRFFCQFLYSSWKYSFRRNRYSGDGPESLSADLSGESDQYSDHLLIYFRMGSFRESVCPSIFDLIALLSDFHFPFFYP